MRAVRSAADCFEYGVLRRGRTGDDEIMSVHLVAFALMFTAIEYWNFFACIEPFKISLNLLPRL
jgi:hypothetical protein